MTRSFYTDILLYGLGIALFLLFIKYLDYGLFVRAIPFEIYVGVIALLFTIFGVWMGLKLTGSKNKNTSEDAQNSALNSTSSSTLKPTLSPTLSPTTLKDLGISQREHEVLSLIAKGYSNQEIADELFISLSTVKSHTSHIFEKLDVRRRTQVIKKAREIGLLA